MPLKSKVSAIAALLFVLLVCAAGAENPNTGEQIQPQTVTHSAQNTHRTAGGKNTERTRDLKTKGVEITEKNEKANTAQNEASESVKEITATETEQPQEPTQTEQPQEVEPLPEQTQESEELPPPAEELAEQPQTCIGQYTVTWYCPCPECCNGNIGALGVELTPGYSVAMPDSSLLGRTVLIDGFGFYRVEDISPDGIADIFVNHHSEIPSCGMVEGVTVYLVG